MHSSNDLYQPYGLFSSSSNTQQKCPPCIGAENLSSGQIALVSSTFIREHCDLIREKARTISSFDLSHLLNEICDDLEIIRNKQILFVSISEVVGALTKVPRIILTTIAQHRFFNLLHGPLLYILKRWNNSEGLTAEEGLMFHNVMKISKPLFSELTNPNNYPPYLTDQRSLDAISNSFLDISKSRKFFQDRNKNEARSFLLLLDIYVDFQKDIYDTADFNQDRLIELVDPVVNCLTSSFYTEGFRYLKKKSKSMSKKNKFFLVKCPTFLTYYAGTRLQQTMDYVLTTMLPKYVMILDDLIPTIRQWNSPTMRAITQMFKIINHAPTYPKISSTHYLQLVDHILKIIDEPKFFNRLRNTLSSRETNLMYYAVSVLVNLTNDPTVLTHIKQKKVTPIFLRLTSAPYEPLVTNINTVLAHATSEDDIKSMQNPGTLLTTVVNSLENTIHKKTDNESEVIQLLETLKGLVQHDQMKEEILKQDVLSFLVECTTKVTQTALPLLFETLWSTSFSQDIAQILRHNNQLLEQVQTISKTTHDESLKKAADGLVWKLVKEPELLDRAAKRAEEDGEDDDEDGQPTTKVIIGPDGKEQVVTTTRRASILQAERIFQYDMMISYCHADKELIVKIHKFLLDQGFKIWIDLNNMFGPAMAAMAEAVENSEFVLLCMSDSYKQSTYCQAEAEYAFNCKRRLVPLIVRPGYKADGWLGFMIGTRIYVDFGFFDFPTACDKLLDEISRQRKRPFASKTTHVAQQVDKKLLKKKEKNNTNNRLKNQKSKHFSSWTESDVLDFLSTHRLIELMPICEKMDGPSLIQLYKMCSSKHNRTYDILNEQFKSIFNTFLPVGSYTRFLSIMEKVRPATPKPIIPPPQPPPPPPPPQIIMVRPPPPQIILPPPPPVIMPPPTPAPVIMPSLNPFPAMIPPLSSGQPPNSGYDILVTSNATPSQMLGMVQRVGSRWQLRESGYY